MQESRGRDLFIATETGGMEEHCFLACSPWLARPFLYNTGEPLRPGVELSTVGWILSHKSLTKKMPIGLPLDQTDGGFFSSEVSFPPDNPNLC